MTAQRNRSLRLILAVLASLTLLFAFVQPAFAASVKMNLVTSIQFDSYGGGGTFTQKYTYNKKGLLTRKTTYTPEGTLQMKIDYSYNSNDLVKSVVIHEFGQKMAVTTYTYNSKKQLTMRVTKAANVKQTTTTSYSYKKGNLRTSTTTYKGDAAYPSGTKIKKTFSFKKNVLSKITTSVSTDKKQGGTKTFAYDKNGFMKKYTYSNGYGSGVMTRKLTYNKAGNKLTKYQDIDRADGTYYKDNVRNLSYKKVSVTKSRSAVVKKQQQEIINGMYGTDLYLGYDFM